MVATTPPLRKAASAATITSPAGANVTARSRPAGGRSVALPTHAAPISEASAAALETDHSRAEQRSRVQIGELGRQRMRKICAGVNVFCIFSVDVVAREHRGVAQVLAIVPAIPARAVGRSDPRYSDAHSHGSLWRRASDHLADDLVTRDDGVAMGFSLPGDVEISSADTALAGQHGPAMQEGIHALARAVARFVARANTTVRRLSALYDRIILPTHALSNCPRCAGGMLPGCKARVDSIKVNEMGGHLDGTQHAPDIQPGAIATIARRIDACRGLSAAPS